MTPQYAVETLVARGWTEQAIAEAVGCTQPTINRIKGGMIPAWDTGNAIVDLAKRFKAQRRRVAA
jgi:transcriptional regulator with XRE-family HTH domain